MSRYTRAVELIQAGDRLRLADQLGIETETDARAVREARFNFELATETDARRAKRGLPPLS